MANVIGPYTPIFYANEALIALRNRLGLAGRIYRGFDDSNTRRTKGDTINVRIPGSFVAQDAPSTAQDLGPTSLDFKVDQWKEVKFKLTDKDLAFTERQIIREHIEPAAYALAYKIEQSIAGLWKYVPWVGSFSSPATVGDITTARQILVQNGVPMDDERRLHAMVSPVIGKELLDISAFTQHQGSGDVGTAAQLSGYLGKRYGFNFFESNMAATATSATVADLAGAVNNVAGYPAGTMSIAVDGLEAAGVLQAGDIVSITGHTQKYVLTSAVTLSSGAGTLNIKGSDFVQGGGLESAVVDNQVITVTLSGGSGATKTQNLFFHEGAFALGLARLPDFMNGEGVSVFATPPDPESNISVRARTWADGDTSSYYVALDVLYGIRILDGNKAVRMLD